MKGLGHQGLVTSEQLVQMACDRSPWRAAPELLDDLGWGLGGLRILLLPSSLHCFLTVYWQVACLLQTFREKEKGSVRLNGLHRSFLLIWGHLSCTPRTSVSMPGHLICFPGPPLRTHSPP